MTTTVPAPSPNASTAPQPTAASAPRRERRLLLGFWAVVLTAFVAVSPGKMTFETKLAVAVDPLGFADDLTHLWQDQAGFGGVANQSVGYAFPMLPYYALMHEAQIPVWFAERLWLSLVVTTAFWGARRLSERLQVGTPTTRLLGAVAYALWPTFTTVVGSTSAAALPGAMLPWVLLPLVSTTSAPRLAAARSALLIPFMGGVNAASTLASLLPVGLYLLSRPAGRRRRALLAWWLPGVVLATAWWAVPLLLLRVYGEDFMPYVEQADTTTATMSATELLRGAGNWVAYLHFGDAWLPAGWTVAAGVVTVLGSALAAALGLAGLARRDIPERRWLVLTVLAVALITLAGYGGPLGAPFHDTVRGWLDGTLRPFRNVYKFQPGLALVLALGFAHVTALGPARRHARMPRVRRHLPAITALLVLPGLAWPYLNGDVLQPGAFTKLPLHWKQAADWLDEHSTDSRALVVPATAHGIYTWGSPIDQPFDVLAKTRWAQRDFVPMGAPGSRRALDAVEQALSSGAQVPGLQSYLARAGIRDVIVRNDLDPDQIGYVPPQTVRQTLLASGYRRAAAFGTKVTSGRIPSGTPVQVQGLYQRPRAVEIYEPIKERQPPGRVGIDSVQDTAIVSGGPEALLQLSADTALRDRPAILAGDSVASTSAPALTAVADGLRRADTRFGLVNANTSHTYTATERNPSNSLQDPGKEPKQILPASGIQHQTTAILRGAASVTASSSGNWLFHLPQYDPVNAFDGNPDTAWAEGSAAEPIGQWLRIDFNTAINLPPSLQLTPLAGSAVRPSPIKVRITTEQGSADSNLRPDGSRQTVHTPRGAAKWLKIEIIAATSARPGLSGAGFAEVSVPGVQVTRVLALPEDAHTTEADAHMYSLHRGTDVSALTSTSAEPGLHRQFDTENPAGYNVKAQAVAVPGDSLDRLLDHVVPGQRNRITASAASTSPVGPSLSARNLVDGDLTTGWIAGDRPVVQLRWTGRTKIGELVFGAAGGLSSRPEEVRIRSPHGSATVKVAPDGHARFKAITTDRLNITITKTAPLTLYNPLADGRLQLPVGLSEIHLPALANRRAPAPDPETEFSLPCGKGPAINVDGTQYPTKASGRIRDLTERRPVSVHLCAGKAKESSVNLSSGTHQVETNDTGALAITDVTLSHGTPRGISGAASRTVEVRTWTHDSRSLAVSAGTGKAAYLRTYENFNDGWTATLNGRTLTPVRLDGWQQAWVIPAGVSGNVHLEYEPADLYRGALIGGAIGLSILATFCLIGRRREARIAEVLAERKAIRDTCGWAPLAPGPTLTTVALTVVVALVAGPFALVVPALAVLARLKPSALAPTAAAAMGIAGIVATVGAGAPASANSGAFSATAQVLALVALSAAVVTYDRKEGPS
ncbi:alpha-(1-_3)-arabinofuranosyltransferase domain-containing protein [Streptomyces chartreusis]|uniref:alpha-(1->3)-arabinofuranosyltransferase domain-containing protein n=1 Tax=Streptomyces chartreusis TaxID=1969 RepID=UPI0033EB5EB8